MDYIKYTLWPLIRFRCIYFWWTVRYGGKKNIPQELIFGQVQRSMKRFAENMEQAFRHMPGDLSQTEKGEVVDLMGLAKKLEEEVKRLESPNKR